MGSNRKTTPQGYGPPQRPTEPPSIPSTPMADHSFLLQSILDLHKSIGKIDGRLDSIDDELNKIAKRMDKMDETVSGITHKLYAAGAVLGIVLCIGGFFITKYWDDAMHMLIKQIKVNSIQ